MICKNRRILDNVFLAYEAMEWAKESKQEMILFLMDVEKAYNIINWTFLKDYMRKLGFSEEWIISWTTIFYEGAKS